MPTPSPWLISTVLACATLATAQETTPVFRSDANLQTIAVRVSDKQGRDVRGLKAEDFTLTEDSHPQKIAFFGAEEQPISLAVLLDSSSSMESSRKLAGARAILKPLLKGNLPEDEIFTAPFTDRVGKFEQLTAEQRLDPPAVRLASLGGGTALYDALATSLCHMKTATNVRQAVVVITDGADQHSRLTLEQLIQLAQDSKPQIFMIGFFDKPEFEVYHTSGKTVTLVSGHDIDNPLHVFARVAKETGAESFFPTNERELQQVIEHILGILQAEYTLAYYPQDATRLRRIQVKVNHGGVTVGYRRSVGSEAGMGGGVHFLATSCEVSAKDHPYPWEPHVTQSSAHTMMYQDNFSDPKSGWPIRGNSHYIAGAYEMARTVKVQKLSNAPVEIEPEGLLAAYGPWFDNFRMSLSVEGSGPAKGLVFRLNDQGCYMLLFTATGRGKPISYKFVKRTFANHAEVELLPWTPLALPGQAMPGKTDSRITVECMRDRFKFLIDGVQFDTFRDKSFDDGYVGMAHYGYGRSVFRDLRVEELPKE